MTALKRKILDIVTIWAQNGLKDHDAMLMIYNLMTEGEG